MTAVQRICADDRTRRAALRATPLNGLDHLEVDELDRHQLTVSFISKLGPLGSQLGAANFVVCGGRRVRDLRVIDVQVCELDDPDADDCVTLTIDHVGDFSTYCLQVVGDDGGPHPSFDPVYSQLDFSFQAGCPSLLDCQAEEVCPPEPAVHPEIDYLAKDFASFRQVLTDRLRMLMPGWTERHEPDLMTTLVELLAYEGDRLSYHQDAVATEAYLKTARQRISVRRHARLVDYFLHEGCNARAWVVVWASQDTPWIGDDDLFFVTGFHAAPPPGTVLSLDDLRGVPESDYEVFEPMPEPDQAIAKVLEPMQLCRRVADGSDTTAAFVRGELDPDVLQALQARDGDERPAPELTGRLVAELERIARQRDVSRAKPFAAHSQAGAARRLLEEPVGRAELVELNRVLLRDAFADELAPPAGVRFLARHNRIPLHTWGERDCCLPRGSTAATLVDEERGLRLVPGDWLLLEEVRDPDTGLAADADVTHRHVVRLTRVTATFDPVLDTALVDVEWAAEDALPFALCLSSRGPAPDCEWFDEVSVARGNVVLADHGRRRVQELDAVEADGVDEACDDCPPERELVPRRYRPVLTAPGLTFAQPLLPGDPAAGRLVQDPHLALPQVGLRQVALAPPRLDVPDPLERYRNPVPLTAFDPEDVLSPAALVARLEPAGDAVASYLHERLDEATLADLAAQDPTADPSEALVRGLLRGLNAALDDEELYAPDRFPDAGLDDATRLLLTDAPLPLDLRRVLRRWLLEQALSGALAPTRHEVTDWTARFDLLAATGQDRAFVVEMTDDRRAALRFGDGELGRRPEAATRFRASFRAGSGPTGNVGAGAIAFVAQRSGLLDGLSLIARNPLPAAGGTDPEALDEARQWAPYSIRRQLARAVIASDYADLAARDFPALLQGAAAALVWTGSWYEADVAVDPWNRQDAPPDLVAKVQTDLEHYRRVGHALRVAAARYVPLDIVMTVCVRDGYHRAHVQRALQDAFSSGRRPTGELGFFHPDNLRFRTSVDVSELVAIAQRVPGVVWCRVDKLERLAEGDAGERERGTLEIAATEIARVDSSHGFPELGSIRFVLDGGR